jgi:hypothetical protein
MSCFFSFFWSARAILAAPSSCNSLIFFEVSKEKRWRSRSLFLYAYNLQLHINKLAEASGLFTGNKATEIFCIAEDFCKEFSK